MIAEPVEDQMEDPWLDAFKTKMDKIRENIIVDHISREDIMVHHLPNGAIRRKDIENEIYRNLNGI